MTDQTTSPRPLDAIKADLASAESAHAAAVAAAEAHGGVIAGLVREYRESLTWFDQECVGIESKYDSFIQKAKALLGGQA